MANLSLDDFSKDLKKYLGKTKVNMEWMDQMQGSSVMVDWMKDRKNRNDRALFYFSPPEWWPCRIGAIQGWFADDECKTWENVWIGYVRAIKS